MYACCAGFAVAPGDTSCAACWYLASKACGTLLQGCVRFLAVQCVDGRLDRLAFRLQWAGKRLLTSLQSGPLAAQNGLCGPARVALAVTFSRSTTAMIAPGLPVPE